MFKVVVAGILLSGLGACSSCHPTVVASADASAPKLQIPSQVAVSNTTNKDTVVFFSFGADSAVLPTAWPFCTSPNKLNCNFPLKAGASKVLPSAGYLNVTVTFGAQVACGTTKAELNVNNPKWYDTADISLVDGYSNDVVIDFDDANGNKRLGPVISKSGNEKNFGVFPLGCDICVARQSPPCGIKPGSDGCKKGTQFSPTVPCQYQGATMGGGANITVALIKPEPASK